MHSAICFFVLLLVCAAECNTVSPIEQTEWLLKKLGAPPTTEHPDFRFRAQGKPQIILIGDSITAFGFVPQSEGGKFGFGPDFRGWALMLNDTLQSQAHIENVAFKAGNNTKEFRVALPALIEQLKPIAHEVALVNIAFGINDAIMGRSGCGTEFSTYVDHYRVALKEAVLRLREIGIQNVMVTSPPPTGFRHARMPDRLNCLTELYVRVVNDRLANKPIAIANIYDALMGVPDWQTTALISDGLHLSGWGNKVMHDVLLEAAQSKYPHVTAHGLPEWYTKNQKQHTDL